MADNIYAKIKKKFILAGVGLATILIVGTIVYRFIGGEEYSFIDSFYMTFITITTIGFGEVIDLTGHHAGRLFTVVTALAGIGLMTYLLMNITAFVVEGHINEAFRRRKMEKMINKFRSHYIVCGMEAVSLTIVDELHDTKRPYVVVDNDGPKLEKLSDGFQDLTFIEGDPTDDDVLIKAGVLDAEGLFAVTPDDNQNLVITLTARQLNADIRIVAGCKDVKNTEKMKKAGAESVVSPTHIGGLRMASEMIRPTVVNFLNIMMSRKDESLRVEEVRVPDLFFSKPISSINLKKYEHLLLLAIKTKDGWIYNPSRGHVMQPGDILIFMATPDERNELMNIFPAES